MSHEFGQIEEARKTFAGALGTYAAYLQKSSGNSRVKEEAELLIKSIRDMASELEGFITK